MQNTEQRTYTPKDLEGIAAALSSFLLRLSGKRTHAKRAAVLTGQLAEAGVPLDVVFNPSNYRRARELNSQDEVLTPDGYVAALIRSDAPVHYRRLTEEHAWETEENGFAQVSEVVHDFFLAVTGKGGHWKTDSAVKNLAMTIRLGRNLDNILSEEVINAVRDNNASDAVSCFAYVNALMKDPFAILQRDQDPLYPLVGTPPWSIPPEPEEEPLAESTIIQNDSDLDESGPMPGEDEGAPVGESPSGALDGVGINPSVTKLQSLTKAVYKLNPKEFSQIASLIEGWESLAYGTIIEKLSAGEFDPTREDDKAREMHAVLNGQLMEDFISCAGLQNVPMDFQGAAKIDLLHDSWDLRQDENRRLQKLKMLVREFGNDDPDLEEAVSDLAAFYRQETA